MDRPTPWKFVEPSGQAAEGMPEMAHTIRRTWRDTLGRFPNSIPGKDLIAACANARRLLRGKTHARGSTSQVCSRWSPQKRVDRR
jgi:hypothetical protein